MQASLIGAVLGFLRQQSADPQLRANLALFGLVLFGAVIAFAMFAVIARYLGPEQFGHFATLFSALSFTAVVAVRGQETLIGRSWNEYAGNGRLDLAGGALVFGIRHTIIGMALAAVAVIAVVVATGGGVELGVAAGAFVAAQAAIAFSSSASRPLAGVFATTLQFELTWRLFTIACVAVLWALALPVGNAGMLTVLAVGTALAVALQAVSSYRGLPAKIDWSRLSSDKPAWSRRAVPMWGAAILEAGSQYIDVVLIGLIIDPTAAGGYFAASRIANAFSKVTLTTSNLAAARVSLLYFSRPRSELVGFIRSVSLSTIILVVGGLAALTLLGPLLLAIFGAEYVDEFWTLLVLSAGTAFVALSGPSPYTLMHTGHEKAYSRTVAFAFVARVLLFFALTPLFGAIGAAFAFTLVAIATSVTLNYACRRLLGIDPSVMSLLTRAEASAQA